MNDTLLFALAFLGPRLGQKTVHDGRSGVSVGVYSTQWHGSIPLSKEIDTTTRHGKSKAPLKAKSSCQRHHQPKQTHP